MRAIVLHEFGPAENLRYEEVDDPEPAAGQVRIAVAASGVHLIDTTIRSGVSAGLFPLPELPTVPGREVAGVVDAVGPGTDEAWLGRRVVAHLGPASRGYAELAVREADAVHALPGNVAEDAAVAMIGTGRTTMAILEIAQLAPGDVVLITAAAGGIGSLLVQAARAAGATVVGAAGGPEKVERVRALGADVAVDYSVPGWSEGFGDVTVALDGVGGELGRQALEAIGVGGRLVLFGYASGNVTQLSAGDLFSRGLTVSAAIGPRILQRPGGMRDLEERALAAVADGSLTPAVQRFPLAEAAAAHAALERRATTGKVVLIP
jgi:NADPH2:quinone reductase